MVHGQKTDASYAPSFGFGRELLSDAQAAVHAAVADIDGWLRPEDSLKLYELGYLAPGPFLEIGTYRGKSTTVLATALRDAGRGDEFYSLDLSGDDLKRAQGALVQRGLASHVTLVHGTIRALFRGLPSFRPLFVFLDGDHSAKGVRRDLAPLEARVPEGGLLLFHDFRDPRNHDPTDADYGVPQAIDASWVARDCEFAGTFGCSGLYRRVRGPQRDSHADTRQLIDLIALDRTPVRLRAIRQGRFRI
jgi:hypothetical protein